MIIAFDIGTSYCRASIVQNDSPVLICSFPSIVSFIGDKIHVGTQEYSHDYPTCTIYDSKRIFENNYGGETVREKTEFELYKTLWTFSVEISHRGTYAIRIKNDVVITPEEVAKILLQHLVTLTEKYLDEPIKNCVISTPNFFTNTHRVSLTRMAESMGFTVKRLISDSSAAAFYYSYLRDSSQGKQTVVLFSIGSGCANVSVFVVDNGRVETKAAACNKFIGGQDFQNEVIRLCCAKAKVLFGKPILGNAQCMITLNAIAKMVVEKLSTETAYMIEIRDFFEGQDFKWNFTRDTFEKANKKRFEELLDPVFDVLENASISRENVNACILVGGASRIPKVRVLLAKLMKNAEFVDGLDPDNAVVFGAAIQAELIGRLERPVVKSFKNFLPDIPFVNSPNTLLAQKERLREESPYQNITPTDSPSQQKASVHSPFSLISPSVSFEHTEKPKKKE